ncbi:MAG: hypothetical protein HND48_11230 [Chloroflexi bacterium]|nr:hypothetical protein [Chloroflexota bacterium]
MCGPVEFGSFTLAPRVGNAGTVLWRDVNGLTTMNRVGLKNPGSAAAEFLSRQPIDGTFGISVATTPEVDDPTVQAAHVAQAIGRFIEEGVRPDWFTVNLSSPEHRTGSHGDSDHRAGVGGVCGDGRARRDGSGVGESQPRPRGHAV